MADRYWVGGSGPWNSTNTTNWSASSGGTSGASVPTAADNVIFNAAGGAGNYSVTIGSGGGVCNDFTVSSSTVTITGTVGAPQISGSFFLAAGSTWGMNGTLTFKATTTGKTITTNGVSLNTTSVGLVFNGVGGGWTLGSALTCSNITLTAGAIDTAGYAVTFGTLTGTGSVVRSLSLGASAIAVTGGGASVWNISGTNITFNAGTSSITFSGSTPTVNSNGVAYYDVAFTSVATNGDINIGGANTYRNFTCAGRAPAGQTGTLTFNADQTITGTLKLGAYGNANDRSMVCSNVRGTQRTLTVAAFDSSSNDWDFRDIVIAGAAAPITATRLGDCGNNSGITFPASKTVYWNLASGSLVTAAGWATAPGGTPSFNNYPLPQDIGMITDSGLNPGATVSLANYARIGTLDFSGRTSNAATLSAAVAASYVYGDLILSPMVTYNPAISLISLGGRTSSVLLDGAGATISKGIYLDVDPNNVVKVHNWTTSTTMTLISGGIDLDGYDLTVSTFSATGATGSIAFGANKITVNGTGTVWSATSLTCTGSRVVYVTNSTATATIVTPGSALESSAVSFVFTAGSYALTISAGSVGDLDFSNGGTSTYSGAWGGTGAINLYGSLILNSSMTSNGSGGLQFVSSTSETITTAGVSLGRSFTFNNAAGTWTLQDSVTTTGNQTLTAGTLSLQSYTFTCGGFTCGASSNTLAFGTGNITVTSFGAVFTGSTTTTVTGTPKVFITNATTTAKSIAPGAVTEANSISFYITAGNYTFNVSTNQVVRDLDFSNGGASTFNGALGVNAFTMYGSLTLNSSMTVTSSAAAITFASTSGIDTITCNGVALARALTFNGAGGTWQLQDALTTSLASGLTAGTLDLQSFTFTASNFSVTGSTARTLAFGTGQITVTGSGTAWNATTLTGFSATGSKTVNISNASATATTVIPGSPSSANALDFNFTTGTYSLTFLSVANYVVRSVNFTGFSGTWTSNLALTEEIYGDLTLSSTMTVGGSAIMRFNTSGGTQVIKTNGKTSALSFSVGTGSAGTVQLFDALTTTGSLTLTSGTFDLNSNTATFASLSIATGSAAREVIFGTASMVITGTGITVVGTNLTMNTGTVSLTSASAKSVSGANWPNITLNQGGAGALTLGTTTFADITNTYSATGATSITITANATVTVSNFSAKGTAGKVLTLSSGTAGTRANLSKSSGTVDQFYTTIKDINATGGATWNALTTNGNVNNGNNLGWIFSLFNGASNFFAFF